MEEDVVKSNYTFWFMDTNSTQSNEIPPQDIFLGIVMILAQLQRHILDVWYDLFISLPGFTRCSLWILAKSFSEDVNKPIKVKVRAKTNRKRCLNHSTGFYSK